MGLNERGRARLLPNWAWGAGVWDLLQSGEDLTSGKTSHVEGTIVNAIELTPKSEWWPRCGNKHKCFQGQCQ